jgi:hypothetical protein
MPLQNRIRPDGEIIHAAWRGSLMGNRGGRIHDPETKTLLKRKWASKRWISCVLEFKNRQRQVMGNSYTELFFSDEVTALATGHRPCFECQRRVANSFAEYWRQVENLTKPPMADEMDAILHSQRLAEPQRVSDAELDALPDGAMVMTGDTYYAIYKGEFMQWQDGKYQAARRPKTGPVVCLTAPIIVKILQAGYAPKWYSSAKGSGHGSS